MHDICKFCDSLKMILVTIRNYCLAKMIITLKGVMESKLMYHILCGLRLRFVGKDISIIPRADQISYLPFVPPICSSKTATREWPSLASKRIAELQQQRHYSLSGDLALSEWFFEGSPAFDFIPLSHS
jgi:hypothetical protein